MKNEHRNEHILRLEITGMKKRYSDPKVCIPKKNGRATLEPNKRWYVYFYWRSDPEGILDKRFAFYKDLNRLKTIKERRNVGKALANALKIALANGWNPETKAKKNRPFTPSEIRGIKERLQDDDPIWWTSSILWSIRS